jgi:pyruvate formate lyase activating enzyme
MSAPWADSPGAARTVGVRQTGTGAAGPTAALPAIAGLEPCSLIDYPGHIAAILFLQGCNFDCGWCHNRHLIPSPADSASAPPILDEAGLATFLASRRDFLDGIVVTGGEPTLHPGLPRLLGLIKDHGYRVKLDTNGSRPAVLAQLLSGGLVDFLAMDLKAPLAAPGRLAEFCGLPASRGPDLEDRLRTSLALLQEWGGNHEIRTTCSPGLNQSDLAAIAEELAGRSPWAIQVWRPVAPGGGEAMGARQLDSWVALMAGTGPGCQFTLRV